MPNKDGSLTDADRVRFTQALNRMIAVEDPNLAAGTLGLIDEVEKTARSSDSGRSAYVRVVEALSLDLMAHAVGGFTAMTAEEQTESLLNIERTLPEEFTTLLGIVRDVYYSDDRTPDRPEDFEAVDQIFGKVEQEPQAEEVERHRSIRLGRSETLTTSRPRKRRRKR
jgi:hypothetical protein